MSIGQSKEAVATFERMIAAAPDSAVAHFELATARAAVKSPDAEAEFRKALSLNPDYTDAANGLALLMVRSGRHEEALRLARDLQKKLPQSPGGYELEGNILMESAKYQGAVPAYLSAFKVAPTGPAAVRLYMALARAGKLQAGISNLEQWVAAYPNDLLVRGYLADALNQSGRQKDAAGHYQVILSRNPNDLLVMNNLALAYHEMKDPRALGLAEKAYQLKPDNPNIADTFGWILLGTGKKDRALELLQKASSQARNSPTIRYHLAVALAESGNRTKAKQELEQALGMNAPFAEKQQAAALLKTL